MIGMNHLRHADLDAAPELRPYFITGWHDDEVGIMATFGAKPGPGGFVHEFVTTPGVLAVVDGVGRGPDRDRWNALGADMAITIDQVVGADLVTVALLATYQNRGAVRSRGRRRARFPGRRTMQSNL